MQRPDRDLLRQLSNAIDQREPIALATVVRTKQSVPRHAGAKMLVWGDGTTLGTIGGGEMEARVIAAAVTSIESHTATLESFDLVDPAAGDPGVCGGTVDVYVEPHMPEPSILIIGAGHVGTAVHELASWLGMPSLLWDDREQPPHTAAVDAVLTGDLDAVLADARVDGSCSVIIVSRSMAVDLEVVPRILQAPVRYVGLMGSKRRWATTRDALVAAGVAHEDLERLHAPIGLDIDAETPEEIAVSILAEVIKNRRGE